MAHITGLFLIDAQASALNNSGAVAGATEENITGVKTIKTKAGTYVYVSSQAYKYWLRSTLEKYVFTWQASPVFREKKIAYTDANPIHFMDDDLFGYMRAPSKKESAVLARAAAGPNGSTEVTETVSRIGPMRVGYLTSLSPVNIVSDFGVMARHEGHPVPYEHQFYRSTLRGLFSLNLSDAGVFSYVDRSGYLNLDSVRVKLAQEAHLEHLEKQKCYRLPIDDRIERVKSLMEGMAIIEGGAKQTSHYTDVTSPLTIFAVTKGGNNIFNYAVKASRQGLVEVNQGALFEALTINEDQLLSPIYVGWTRGFCDEERAEFEHFVEEYNKNSPAHPIMLSHPRLAFKEFVQMFDDTEQVAPWLA